MFATFRCLDLSEEIDLINVAFEQKSTIDGKQEAKFVKKSLQ